MDCLQLHTEKEKTRKDYALRVDPKPRLKKTPSVRYIYIYIYLRLTGTPMTHLLLWP